MFCFKSALRIILVGVKDQDVFRSVIVCQDLVVVKFFARFKVRYVVSGLSVCPRGHNTPISVLNGSSARKFFRTQMASLGVDRDYIEYMMGHTISTYHDIKMKGIEYLKGIYLASGLSIRPKTRVSKIDALKEIIRAWELDHEEILTRDALTRPNMTVINQDQLENHQLAQLTTALRQQMLKEIRENQPEKSMNSHL